ncbi:carboxymuconolactone decarboxylase family protein [Microbacterium album]|uniref:Carboxymuconolactone decarboxylase n=1 Tax=Microbacterium album TaxID=2053191 RepID=A0A917MM85_9MICO|nr:hypothetical protein [Microbacterium album]GGH47309.1 hypothetical protein GCM10010921_23940 [Microbacterium album]
MTSSPRVPPVDDLTLEAYRLPDGRPLQLFALLGHAPAAFSDLKGATARSLEATTLPVRMRELLILRVLHRFAATPEWQVHVTLFADAAGMDEGDLDGLTSTTPAFTGTEADIVAFADGLCDGGNIDDALWNRLVGALGTRGAVEATFVGAQYAKVAIMTNVLRVPPLETE